MISQTIINADHYLFNIVNGLAFKWLWLDMVGMFLADYFPYFVGIALLLFLIKFRKSWKMVFTALIASVVARYGIVEEIRWFKPRLRPFNTLDINLLIGRVNEFSFPSGHAAFFFALATVVFLNNKKAGVIFYLAAALISIARVFAGVHWPLDIIVGAFVGIAVGLLADNLYKKIFRKS